MSTAAHTQIYAAALIGWMADDPDAVTVLDVRSPAKFETGHIAGSYNLSLNLLSQHATTLAARLNGKVVLVCQSGVRADQAEQRLGTGMDNLHVLIGGIAGYAAAGGQIVDGAPSWSMERQVRLVAGSLVLIGVLASRFAPKAVLLAGAIGSGLAISALTDTCTMGRILSALPHNRGTKPTAHQLLDQLPAAAEPAAAA